MNQDLSDARHRELERLQHLLETDPDRGLHFAIPLRNAGTRGMATPGARLPPHDPRFNLNRLGGGGGAADPWQVRAEIRRRLMAQYRVVANRELNLGRYRRAAYIFAELLGDYTAAASALEQGRHYRDAAALYQDYLKSPLKAAECLERGGLLPEAIALYERWGRLEKAGDLYALLERPEDASRCYRAVVEQHLLAKAWLAAAKLLEGKLTAPDEALSVLSNAWPDSDAAGTCLRESFQLLARLGRHEETVRRVVALPRQPLPGPRLLPLVEVLGHVAGSYPNPAARTLAADAARSAAGGRLRSADEAERTALVKVVTGLAPEDRLLPRDGSRYLSRQTPAPPPRKPLPARYKVKPGDPVGIRQFRVAVRRLETVISAGPEFFAAGTRSLVAPTFGPASPSVVLLRGRWDGRIQSVSYGSPDRAQVPKVLSYDQSGPRLLCVPGPSAGPDVRFEPTDDFPDAVPIGCPPWISPDESVGLCHDEQGATYMARCSARGELVLSVYRAGTDSVLATFDLMQFDLDGPVAEAPQVVARAGHAYVTFRGRLFRVFDGKTRSSSFAPVKRMAASAPHTRPRIALATGEGGVVVWEGADTQSFGEGLSAPHVAFTRGGLLVAVSGSEGRVYGTDGARVTLAGSFRPPGPGVSAVTPAARLNEFAVFTTDGAVTVYQVPG